MSRPRVVRQLTNVKGKISMELHFQRTIVSFFPVLAGITLTRPSKCWLGEEVMGLSWVHKSEWLITVMLMAYLSLQALLESLRETDVSIASYGRRVRTWESDTPGFESQFFCYLWSNLEQVAEFSEPQDSFSCNRGIIITLASQSCNSQTQVHIRKLLSVC